LARVRTHYDNLKVSRDAPAEVIHAAFNSLAAKYSPGVKARDSEATRIAMIVNRSYAVLSDPAQRAEHDRWIANAERQQPRIQDVPIPEFQQVTERRFPGWFATAAIGVLAALFLIGLFLVVRKGVPNISKPPSSASAAPVIPPPPPGFDFDQPPQKTVPVPAAKIYTAVPKDASVAASRVPYLRPELAPNGQPWPNVSVYLLDQAEDGNSVVIVDNTQNSADMLVELYDRAVNPPTDVRVVFLRAREQFRMQGARAGTYDLRYQDLDSGVRRKSEPFDLTERQEGHDITKSDRIIHVTDIDGTEFTLTLYRRIDGNTDSTIIGAEEFDSRFLSRLPRPVNRKE
jgi:hypothetical protein